MDEGKPLTFWRALRASEFWLLVVATARCIWARRLSERCANSAASPMGLDA